MGLGFRLSAGFFGIGGGFRIVPALIAATAMPFAYAVGTSLVVVTALGLTTAIAMRLVRIGAGPVTGFDVAYSMARSVCVARRWPRGRAIKTASAPVVQRCHPAEGCARASDAASSRPGLHPRRAFHPASRHLHKRRSAERRP